jgi:tripartite ATP-independent transporter DctM subunit
MEWWLALLSIFGALLILMAIGLPLMVCFMLVVLVGAFLLMGGERGLAQATLSIFGSVAHFTLLPLPLFILMGEVMYQSGIAPEMMKSLDIWLGRLPGRLSLLAVGSGTMLSFLTGASMASVAILGSTLVPEMKKRGYHSSMTLGPILGSGGLAVMIPPSAIAILFGVIAEVSIGRILIAIIIPGLIMASLYAAYVVIRCSFQPHIAPPYDMPPIPIKQKIALTLKNIVPLSVIIFLVTGVILLGIATPTEAAATGALGTFLVVAAYRRLSWEVVKKSVTRATSVTVMIFIIIL